MGDYSSLWWNALPKLCIVLIVSTITTAALRSQPLYHAPFEEGGGDVSNMPWETSTIRMMVKFKLCGELVGKGT